MGVSIQFRRGTASDHDNFTGSEGEITVLQSDAGSGDPWRLKVHDGSASYIIPTIDSADSLTNKTMTSPKWSGTITDRSSNLLASIGTGEVTYASGSVVLDNAYVIDQSTEKTLEAMMERVARKK